jgi:hypothetical protein
MVCSYVAELENYRLPPVPVLGHVMRKAGNHNAGKARHLRKPPQRKEKGDRYHVDALYTPRHNQYRVPTVLYPFYCGADIDIEVSTNTFV